jgi:phosphate-selective porin OprO and OprP
MKKARLFGTLALIGSVVIGPVELAFAQNADSSRQSLEDRLQLLEKELKRLQPLEVEVKALKALVEEQKKVVAEKEAVAAEREAVATKKAEAVAQELKVLQRQREVDKEAEVAAAQKLREMPVVTAGPEGLGFKSADGNFAVRLRGVLQADGEFLHNDAQNKQTDTFYMDKVRPIVEGTVYKDFDFKFMPDFGQGKAVIQDAFADARFLPEASLRVGKFKSPVGLERLQQDQDVKFAQRGLPTDLAPNRDIGLEVYGDFLTTYGDLPIRDVNSNGVFSYQIGVFDGTSDGGSYDTDENNSKDVAARIFARPFKLTDIEPLQGLGLGVAGTLGQENGAAPAYKTIGQQTFFTYAAGVTANGNRVRLSPQGYYYWGPFGLLGEYIISSEQASKGAVQRRFENSAWQISTTYVLTGEKAAYTGVVPDKPFDLSKGHWGAFELAARFGELNVDRASFQNGFADPTVSASGAADWGVGLNWYLNKNFRIVLDYDETHFTGGAPGGDRPHERVVFTQFQLAF